MLNLCKQVAIFFESTLSHASSAEYLITSLYLSTQDNKQLNSCYSASTQYVICSFKNTNITKARPNEDLRGVCQWKKVN